MSFATAFTARVISPLANLSRELLDRVPSEAETGWDTMRDRWLIRIDAAANDPSALFSNSTFQGWFARGLQVSGRTMWTVSSAPRLRAPGLFEVESISMGLLSARGYKVTYDAAGAGQTAENITNVPNPTPPGGTGTYAKLATKEADVTATFEYVNVASVIPTHADFLTKDTGRAKDPPSGWAPTVPDTVWAFLTQYTYNYPNGWVFEGATMENLPGINTVFLVREKYRYIQLQTP